MSKDEVKWLWVRNMNKKEVMVVNVGGLRYWKFSLMELKCLKS